MPQKSTEDTHRWVCFHAVNISLCFALTFFTNVSPCVMTELGEEVLGEALLANFRLQPAH